jgi:glycerate 2-kinase
MHIVIAPNAFKNSLTAAEAAGVIGRGLKASRFTGTVQCFPIADGGDGTGELIIQHCRGQVVTVLVRDPLGRSIHAGFGLIDEGKTAVIEMAGASGLRLLAAGELTPLRASSYGTGELIRHALDRDVRKIILGIGGSATVDGGCGILQALGVRFFDGSGLVLEGLPERLTELSAIDLSGLDKRLSSCEIVVLCDVDNKLLGADGAAHVFGPQKGASPPDIVKLDAALKKLAEVVLAQLGVDMAGVERGGAAGGIAAGLCAFLNARLVNGIDEFLTITDFDKVLEDCDLLITGEGSLDEQTLNGKGPMGVAARAKARNILVMGLAGRVPREVSPALARYFDVVLPIGNEPMGLEEAMRATAVNLERTAREVGNLLSLPQSFDSR